MRKIEKWKRGAKFNEYINIITNRKQIILKNSMKLKLCSRDEISLCPTLLHFL